MSRSLIEIRRDYKLIFTTPSTENYRITLLVHYIIIPTPNETIQCGQSIPRSLSPAALKRQARHFNKTSKDEKTHPRAAKKQNFWHTARTLDTLSLYLTQFGRRLCEVIHCTPTQTHRHTYTHLIYIEHFGSGASGRLRCSAA